MELALGIIGIVSILNFGIKSAEFVTDQYAIYKQVKRVKKIFVKPTIKPLYIIEENSDEVIIKDTGWLIVDL